MDLQELKDFLRVDFDEDDNLINSLNIAAAEYLSNAGCNSSIGLYPLAIKMLVSHWYENREVIGTDKKMAYSLQAIIIQLQNCGDI